MDRYLATTNGTSRLAKSTLTAICTSTAAASIANGQKFFRWRTGNPACEIFARWINRLADDLAINHDDWQAVGSSRAQQMVNRFVFDEGLWLLSEVVTLDVVPLVFKPIEIRGKLRQHGIDFGATDASRAAHGFVINLY